MGELSPEQFGRALRAAIQRGQRGARRSQLTPMDPLNLPTVETNSQRESELMVTKSLGTLCIRHYPNGIMTAHVVEEGEWATNGDEEPDATGCR